MAVHPGSRGQRPESGEAAARLPQDGRRDCVELGGLDFLSAGKGFPQRQVPPGPLLRLFQVFRDLCQLLSPVAGGNGGRRRKDLARRSHDEGVHSLLLGKFAPQGGHQRKAAELLSKGIVKSADAALEV